MKVNAGKWVRHLMAYAGLLPALLWVTPNVQGTLPQYSSDKHLGVASCASSQCHGAVKKYEDSNIRRNEYRTWSREDAHARAYSVLRTKVSKDMARKLGLKNAHEAKVCLDCHTDNVDPILRGKKFRLSDGVGCEACHGGSENWIKSHTEKGATHEDNVSKGLFPSEVPVRRAELCLSCHFGGRNKFATHELMAAGHPRLSFELDTFTLTQTHYDIDEDYLRRKTFPGNVETWANGVAQTARQNLEVINNIAFHEPGVFPEIALFDCHACHHTMNDQRWKRRTTTGSLPPGAIRLNDSAFVMLYIISLHVSPDDSQNMLQAIRSIHRSTLVGSGAMTTATQTLKGVVDRIQNVVIDFNFGQKLIRGIRKSILDFGSKGEFRDYSGAEQATMAIDLLTFALGEDVSLKNQLDRLYSVLENESRFSPSEFEKAVRAFQNASR